MSKDYVSLGLGEIPFLVRDRETGKMRPNPAFPKDGFCKSGHVAPDGVRFFHASGSALAAARAGVYCELCIMVASKHKDLKKVGKHHGFSFTKELRLLTKKAEEKNRGTIN